MSANDTLRAYGAPPHSLGQVELPEWTEFMHYMYLPVVMAGSWPQVRLPKRLRFAAGVLSRCLHDFEETFPERNLSEQYVYLTARRGYATPGNPLNRPGWHCDGLGTEDINWVWTDRYPTLYAAHPFSGISDDHTRSIEQFEQQARATTTHEDGVLLRLDRFVVHAAPEIPSPGGIRSFMKVSISPDRYNLIGNSHNYLFDYQWQMHERSALRNDPAYQERDSGPQCPAHNNLPEET